jgi:hypothetical protein
MLAVEGAGDGRDDLASSLRREKGVGVGLQEPLSVVEPRVPVLRLGPGDRGLGRVMLAVRGRAQPLSLSIAASEWVTVGRRELN